MVVDRERNLRGVVMAPDVAKAVERGQSDLAGLLMPAVAVTPHTAVADLFAASADSPSELAVVDDGRLVGVIARVTLLSALGAVGGARTTQPDDLAGTAREEVHQ
jgi:glycine betaine/proline transport system ATP-binding protein